MTRKSILEEISSYVPNNKKEDLVESKADHAISSAIHILNLIEENFSAEEADKLEKRFINSIKRKDPQKFIRSIRKLKEEKRGGNES